MRKDDLEQCKVCPYYDGEYGGWISIKDRMPENQIPVLVYVPPHKSGQDEYTGYVGMAYYTVLGKGWWAGTDGAVYGAIGFIHEPTHWMPLPEPPET